MTRILQYLLFIFSCLEIQGQSRFPVITVYSGSGFYLNEPSICIDPENPDIMVAGSVLNDFYYSSDGGVGWTRGTLTCPWGVWGDPVVIFDTNSNYYNLHLAYPSSPGWWLDRIILQDVIIPGVLAPDVYPVISTSGFSCNNLVIRPEASMTVVPGTIVKVAGNVIMEN